MWLQLLKRVRKISAAEKEQLAALEQNVKAYEQMADQQKKRTVDDAVRSLTSRLRTVNAVAVTTRNGLADLEKKTEKRTATTGCGQGTVFGDLMADVESIRLDDGMRIDEETLFGLLNAVRTHESIYKQAGAVHGCALAQGADILTFVEDVGRHNAVDAIAGWMWLEGVEGHDKVFYTTGRLTSEMVIKAAQMRVPVLVSRSGLTKMGHEIASQVGITMIGRAVGKHYLLFTGAHRLVKRG